MRLQPNGAVDTSFDAPFEPKVYSVEVISATAEHGILVLINSQRLRRLAMDGSTEAEIVLPINGTVTKAAQLPDGRLVLAGGFTYEIAGMSGESVIRLLPTLQVDPAFRVASGTNGFLHGIATRDDGTVFVAGDFRAFGGVAVDGFVRLHSDGKVDVPFSTKATDPTRIITAVLPLASGQCVIAGDSFVNGVVRSFVTLLNQQGQASLQLADVSDQTNTLATLKDGSIAIGGSLRRVNGP